MTTVLRIVTIVVLFALAPGSRELLEQAGHRMVAGHSSHAASHPEGAEGSSDEDSCGGAMHVCHCCSVPALALALTLPSVALDSSKLPSRDSRLTAGFTFRLFRPPLA